ncbi:AAA family ATPase [Streptomyces tendae]
MGKTVAVGQALRLLPGRVPVWRAVADVAPGLPQLRASLCEAFGLPSGALPHRAGLASQALTRALAGPGVLFIDDAQRLTPPLLGYLRQLWDAPGCAAALVVCGAGSEGALARASALRSRVLTWHQVGRLEPSQVPQTLTLFHPVWAQADPDELARADEQMARGNFPHVGEDHVACLRGPRARPRTACGPGADRAGLRASWPLPVTVRAARRAHTGAFICSDEVNEDAFHGSGRDGGAWRGRAADGAAAGSGWCVGGGVFDGVAGAGGASSAGAARRAAVVAGACAPGRGVPGGVGADGVAVAG